MTQDFGLGSGPSLHCSRRLIHCRLPHLATNHCLHLPFTCHHSSFSTSTTATSFSSSSLFSIFTSFSATSFTAFSHTDAFIQQYVPNNLLIHLPDFLLPIHRKLSSFTFFFFYSFFKNNILLLHSEKKNLLNFCIFLSQ